MYEWLEGKNSNAVKLLDGNYSLSEFIARIVYNFDTYCRDKGLNPYQTKIEDAIISRDGHIVARIEGVR